MCQVTIMNKMPSDSFDRRFTVMMENKEILVRPRLDMIFLGIVLNSAIDSIIQRDMTRPVSFGFTDIDRHIVFVFSGNITNL